jgi:hypothetical protein
MSRVSGQNMASSWKTKAISSNSRSLIHIFFGRGFVVVSVRRCQILGVPQFPYSFLLFPYVNNPFAKRVEFEGGRCFGFWEEPCAAAG